MYTAIIEVYCIDTELYRMEIKKYSGLALPEVIRQVKRLCGALDRLPNRVVDAARIEDSEEKEVWSLIEREIKRGELT